MYYTLVLFYKITAVFDNYDINKDQFILFVKSDDNYDYIAKIAIPDKVVDFDLYASPEFDIDKWYKSAPEMNNSLFIESIKQQLLELTKVKEEAIKFYTESLITVPQTPAQVNHAINFYKVRILRLREILKNRGSIMKIVNKNKNVAYFVIKGYYSDEYGNVSRNYSKTFLKEGKDIQSKLKDIYEEMGYECRDDVSYQKENDTRNKRRMDMLITKKSEKKVVEFSKMKKEDLAHLVLNIEMWKDYKLTYKNS